MPEDVVICGAGPNGLMLACELALGGVRPVVLDGLAGPSDEPKANGLVGQIIRQLDMRGLYQEFSGTARAPEPIDEWIFAAMSLSFVGVEDNPMHALMVPQPRLVRLLERRARDLAVDVRWGHELVGFEQDRDGVTVAVHGPDGEYRCSARYLVGADGGRSVVRKTAGIDFVGSTSDMVARVAHVHLPDSLRTDDGGLAVPGFGRIPHGHNRFDRGGLIFADFEPGRPMFGTIEFDRRTERGPLSLDELRSSARRVLGVDVPLEAPRGPGPHALRLIDGQNTRLAQRYRAGRVLLVGDAAHVHSPMGGPGLNLGLQDTVNLGWKLAAEVTGWAPDGLLDTYESERRPVGERVMMQSLSQQALMAPGPEVGALRALFGELLEQTQVRAHMAKLLAGSDGRRVTELMRAARPVLLDLTGTLEVRHDRLDVVTGSIAERPAAAMLIRPDGYVAWAADELGPGGPAGLLAALRRWCGVELAVTPA